MAGQLNPVYVFKYIFFFSMAFYLFNVKQEMLANYKIYSQTWTL